MSANRSIMVSTKDYNYMQSFDKLSPIKERNLLKEFILGKIQYEYDDKYYRLSEGTKKAVNRICSIASERGFVSIQDEKLSNKYGISSRTIRSIYKDLRIYGLVITAHRSSRKHNGRGYPIHFFVHHPYMDDWCSLLNLDRSLV